MPTLQVICLSLSAGVDLSHHATAPTQLYHRQFLYPSINGYIYSTLQDVTYRATEKEKNVQTVGSLLKNINSIFLTMQIAPTVRLFGLV